MDVKCGSGAFMKKFEDAKNLAVSIVETAKFAGVSCNAIITRMDYPIGEMIGNGCEMWESLQCFDPNSEFGFIVKNRIEFD